MQKVSFIYLKGDFNSESVRSFKHKLRNSKSRMIIVRINSYGGNLHAMNTMSAFLYFMKKYRGREIVIEIEHAESAALMFAVNFPHRHITKKSIVSIHLPVLIKGKVATKTTLESKKNKAINFFMSKTKLKREEINHLDGKLIFAKEMFDYGIATKLVEKFYEPLD